jgi:O-Antigen ligase
VLAAVGLTGAINGGYFPTEWGWPALAFVLVVLLALLLSDGVELGRREVVVMSALAAFLVWTLVSIVWSVSATEPVRSAELLLVYVTFLPAALLVTTRRTAVLLSAGVVAAATCVCAYSVATRLFPGKLESWPPRDGYQLATPIGYWNGIGILATLGALAALWFVATASPAWRAAAAATLPLLLTALYLTFSRGSAAAFALGLLVAFALAAERLRFAAVATLALVFASVAVLFARHAHALTHAGASLADASSAGHRLALVLVLCTLASAAVGWSLMPEPTLRPIGIAVVALVVLALLAAVVKEGGPVALADRATKSFRAPLPRSGGDLNRRLVSLSSNGRSEYWRVATVEIRDVPLLGGGAGSYERYWHRERRTSYETRNAHSLYLETLAELGPLGLVLLLVALALPLVGARAAPGAAAAYAAFLAHAALDWDWQIPADTLAGLACAAALLAAARATTDVHAVGPRVRAVATVGLVPLAACAIVVEVGNSALARSSAAFDAARPQQAAREARRAHTWAPWSAEPWQRLGEAQLGTGDLVAARRSFLHALRLDDGNWNIWYELAEASSGAARRDALTHARHLNPRSREVASLERG